MSELRLDDYLGHIEQAANEALDFMRGVTEDEFRTDLRTQRAVIMNLVVIGEAAVRIGEKYPDFVQR